MEYLWIKKMRRSTKTKKTSSAGFKQKKKGSRKAPRKSKITLTWESKFLPLLKEMHGNHAQKIFHSLMKKSSNILSSLKRRSKEYEVIFQISLGEVRRLLLRAYGNKCKYCSDILDFRNMVCDHMVPISTGGESTAQNLEMICKRCNTRKGPLTVEEYTKVVKWLATQPESVSSYINRKLSSKNPF
jgi:hypothetical protein